MTSRIPPLLQPHIRIPEKDSLTLVTSVLGATGNWLLLRYLYILLGHNHSNGSRWTPAEPQEETQNADDVKVVFVSFLRDREFWKAEARRAVGLDITRLDQQGKLRFVDGMSSLFLPRVSGDLLHFRTSSGTVNASTVSHRGSPAVQRGPSVSESVPEPQQLPAGLEDSALLKSASLKHVFETINHLIQSMKSNDTSSRVVLVIDAPSILLQTTNPPITANELTLALLQLRTSLHAIIVAIPADRPLLQSQSGTQTPLELDNVAFTIGMAHQADQILSCRTLGTGWAGDVSGVLRITRGGQYEDHVSQRDTSLLGQPDGEWLYHVGGDGGVKVWTRGSVAD